MPTSTPQIYSFGLSSHLSVYCHSNIFSNEHIKFEWIEVIEGEKKKSIDSEWSICRTTICFSFALNFFYQQRF